MSNPAVISALSAALVAIIGAIFAGLASLRANGKSQSALDSSTSAHMRLDAMNAPPPPRFPTTQVPPPPEQ